MKDKKATGIIPLLHQIFSFFNLAEIKFFHQYLSDGFFKIGKSKMRSK